MALASHKLSSGLISTGTAIHGQRPEISIRARAAKKRAGDRKRRRNTD
jgi:hypothetical protein